MIHCSKSDLLLSAIQILLRPPVRLLKTLPLVVKTYTQHRFCKVYTDLVDIQDVRELIARPRHRSAFLLPDTNVLHD